MQINVPYQSLQVILDALHKADMVGSFEYALIANAIQDSWHTGRELTPMGVPFLIRIFKSGLELIVTREELCESYSPSRVRLENVDNSEVIELDAGEFRWRRL